MKKNKNNNNILNSIHDNIMSLNNSKYFAGVIMILFNIGSKIITVNVSKSTEEYLKYSITKQILIFSMAWMATHDIYTSLMLTAVFVILSDYLLNEESSCCIVPNKYRVLHKLLDINKDGKISQDEIDKATKILEKANKENKKIRQKELFTNFDFQKI